MLALDEEKCAGGCGWLINFWCIEIDKRLYHLNCARRLKAIGVIDYEFMAAVRYMASTPA